MDCFDIRDMEAYLFDLDGCIYHGSVPEAVAKQLLQLLMDEGKSYFLLQIIQCILRR